MHRIHAWGWLAFAALALAGGDAIAAEDDKPGTLRPRDDAPARPFIERTLLLAPEQVGDLKLVDVHAYDRAADGVGFRYQHPGFPTTRIDIFVYPRGRADRDTALDDAMKELRAGIDYAVEQGGYGDLAYGEEGAIDLARVASDGSLLPEQDAEADAAAEPDATTGDDAAQAEAIAGLLDAETARNHGRRLPLRLSIGGDPLDSRAYLFYDALYLFKGRISASPQDLPGETLDRFADRVMADLVPKIEVRNTGGCASHEVYVDPDADDGGDALMQQLAAVLNHQTGEDCASTLDETVPAGFRAATIEFPAGSWGD